MEIKSFISSNRSCLLEKNKKNKKINKKKKERKKRQRFNAKYNIKNSQM